jgi:hypothetical protein
MTTKTIMTEPARQILIAAAKKAKTLAEFSVARAKVIEDAIDKVRANFPQVFREDA